MGSDLKIKNNDLTILCSNDLKKFSNEFINYYEEKTIKLSNDKKQKAIKVFKELSKKTGKKSFNANDVELTENEENTLISIVLSSY